jgi:hypothetical protein
MEYQDIKERVESVLRTGFRRDEPLDSISFISDPQHGKVSAVDLGAYSSVLGLLWRMGSRSGCVAKEYS